MDPFGHLQKKGKVEPKRAAQPWIEKYRPKTVEDVAYQDEVVRTLRKSLETGNLPHLLFYGPPGTGKTSTILAIAKQLYGPLMWKDRVLELNASDERGISVVRGKVKSFAQFSTASKKPDGYDYPCPPYKIIILDEADSMTSDAQSALRRTMETYSNVTRFCLICNYVSRIIEPLASRCAKFRFKSIGTNLVISRMQTVCAAERFHCSTEVLRNIADVSKGDLRKAITFLQSVHVLYGERATQQDVLDVAAAVPTSVATDILDACRSQEFAQLTAVVQRIVASGYAANLVIAQLADAIVSSTALNDNQKARVLLRLGECDRALVEGADEELQLLAVASSCMRAIATP